MTTGGTGTWIGDGKLDGTLRFDSIQLTYNPGSAAEGTVYFDDLRLLKKASVGVDEATATVPSAFALYQNYPNPFWSEAAVRSAGSSAVRTLVDTEQPAGDYTMHWDGKDAEGRLVASGTYLYKLTAGDFTQTKRMLLVR
jgi:hypothetical protein